VVASREGGTESYEFVWLGSGYLGRLLVSTPTTNHRIGKMDALIVETREAHLNSGTYKFDKETSL
jgi:hypothetical protein